MKKVKLLLNKNQGFVVSQGRFERPTLLPLSLG